MDRTKEFLSLAATASIPQKRARQSEDTSLIRVEAIERDLCTLENAVSRRSAPSKELIARIEDSLETLQEQQAEKQGGTEMEECIIKALQRKHTGFVLRLTGALSRHRENEQRLAVELQQEEQARRSRTHGRAQDSQYVQREVQREEISSIRKREFEALEQHISELGRMVTEVSMHISMQGERVDTVDSLFTKTKSNLRGGSYELKEALEKVNQKRRTILLVFAALFAVLLLKYFRWI
ncbi:uncharacterized protein NEMAJ01_1301 [Nematocida major]|uniref:uncharacterized protein n=1 Tax=Nematocida major TaxID=1912982 RepID=UPI002007BCFE|nr:uncharacterized protein NEMAJ01_1301 [Nematocida major]KAH9386405.1 hypothetical protein NEMAJ01_1301 [Nematocida major]